MQFAEFLKQLSRMEKRDIDGYLKRVGGSGSLEELYVSFEKGLKRGWGSTLRIDKLSAQDRYLLLNLLSQGGGDLLHASKLLNSPAKKRLDHLLGKGVAGPVYIFMELVASLLDSSIYPDFNLVKGYALPGAPKILLLSPRYSIPQDIASVGRRRSLPTMGVLRLVTFLRALGMDADFFTTVDMVEIAELKDQIRNKDYDFIGSSMWDDSFTKDLEIIFQLKEEFPDKVFVIGGQGVEFNERERQNLFDNTPVEIMGRGWSEFGLGSVMLDLVHKPQNPLESFKKYVGFYVKSTGFPGGLDTGIKTDLSLDDFRVISLIFDPRIYPEKFIKVEFSTSNYCPRGCVFCSCTNFTRPQPVLRLYPEDAVHYIKKLRKHNRQLRRMYLYDDTFLGGYVSQEGVREGGEQWVKSFSALIKKEGLSDLSYSLNLTADTVTRNTLVHLKEMGAVLFVMGIESFSDQVLKGIRKGTSEEMNVKAIEECFHAGVIPSTSYVLFSPWETLDSMWRTIDVLSKLIFKSADFQFVVKIYEGLECQTSSAMKKVEGINFLTRDVSISGYREKLKSCALPLDAKARELFMRAVLDKDERAGKIREKGERESKERFFTYLILHALNFRSAINGSRESIAERIQQRLVGVDPVSSLLSMYNIYFLAVEHVDFAKGIFTEADRASFLEKQQTLARYIHQQMFEGPLVTAILSLHSDLNKLKRSIKMAAYLFLSYSMSGFSEDRFNLRFVSAQVKLAELCQIRADLELFYFLYEAEGYYGRTGRETIAGQLSRVRSTLLSKSFVSEIKLSILPYSQPDNPRLVLKTFVEETERLRLKVMEILGG